MRVKGKSNIFSVVSFSYARNSLMYFMKVNLILNTKKIGSNVKLLT